MTSIDKEAVEEIANKLIEKEVEINRLKKALEVIAILYSTKNTHLGRPRWDNTCIECLAYFALNNGDYGVFAPTERFQEALKQAVDNINNANK